MRPCWIALLCGLTSVAEARDVYVDAVIGDDTFTGASPATPFRTLTRATGEWLLPGDHIRVAPGTYDTALGEIFPISIAEGVWVNGSAAGGVVVRNDAPALGIPDRDRTLVFYVGGGVEHLRIEGLGLARSGIEAQQDFLVRECEVTGFATGVLLANPHAEWVPSRWGMERRVERSLVHGNDTGIMSGILSCVTNGNQTDVIMNNLIVDNGTGVDVWSSGFAGATVNNFSRLWNNTIADNRGDAIVTSCFDPNTQNGGISAPQLVNNIISGNGGYGLGGYHTGGEFSANLFWANVAGDAKPAFPLAPDNRFAAPLFVNPSALDYHLLAGSPGVEQGREGGPAVQDFELDPRPLDGDGDSILVTDIGYDELRLYSAGPRLRRALFGRLTPITPVKDACFPFLAANTLTPIIRDPFVSGDPDPWSGILDDVMLPLALYQVVEPEPGETLLAIKDPTARTVVFYLTP